MELASFAKLAFFTLPPLYKLFIAFCAVIAGTFSAEGMVGRLPRTIYRLVQPLFTIPKIGMIIPHMGMNTIGLADALFSKVQQRVLGLLFTHPDRSFYTNEIVRFVDSGIGAVQRELEKLAASGLVTVRKIGNQKHYLANRDAPIFNELRGIILKTVGLADILRLALLPLSARIQAAFIYGSVARKSDTARSDIDVLIISNDLAYADVYDALNASEAQLGRPVNPSIYSAQELERKLAEDNAFVSRVLKQEKIFLIGSENDIPTS